MGQVDAMGEGASEVTILGFQVVLLDEQGQEVERIPDVYEGSSWIVIGDHGYGLERTAFEGGQRVRYFKRVTT
jgi:hypothetical protein